MTLQVYVRPLGERLSVLVRAPVEAMQEMPLPIVEPGYLDLARAREGRELHDAAMLWIAENVELYEDGRRLPPLEITALRVSLPSDRSFASWESALAHVRGDPLPDTLQIPWRQAMLDVLFETAIESEESELSIRPRFERLALRVVTVLRFLPPGGTERAFELRGDPGVVRLDPRWHQAAWHFVELGFRHILSGADHLLFLACLVIPLRLTRASARAPGLRQLVLVVTSFTVAHSVTLIASAYGLAPDALWFPPLVELLIAASIVYMALENLFGLGDEWRFAITFAFGLVHGFGFSFALRETLQFAGSHLLTSLLAFNVGVELGQLLVLLLLLPLLELLRRSAVERLGLVVLSVLVGHTAWHWLTERSETFAAYTVAWPVAGLLPGASLPWLAVAAMLLVIALRARRRDASAAARDTRAVCPESLRGAQRPDDAVSTAAPTTLRPPIHTE